MSSAARAAERRLVGRAELRLRREQGQQTVFAAGIALAREVQRGRRLRARRVAISPLGRGGGIAIERRLAFGKRGQHRLLIGGAGLIGTPASGADLRANSAER